MRFRMRGPFRRPGLGRPGLPPLPLPQVLEANRLFERGRFADAAPLYAQLSNVAETHRRPRQAVRLQLRAIESYARGGNPAAALSQARAAMNMALQHGAMAHTSQLLQRVAAILRQNGLTGEAEAIEREFGGQVSGAIPEAAVPPASRRGRLPAQCPQCGAPVRSDEVEWIDDDSAECAYCGSVLQAT